MKMLVDENDMVQGIQLDNNTIAISPKYHHYLQKQTKKAVIDNPLYGLRVVIHHYLPVKVEKETIDLECL